MIYAFGFAAFCFAWLLPGHYFPWYSFQQEALAAIGASLVAVAALVSTGRRPIRVDTMAIGALLLAMVPMVQWGIGRVDFLADAVLPTLYLAAFGVTVVAATVLADVEEERFLLLFAVAVLLAAATSTTIALGQWLRLDWVSFVEQLDPASRVSANLLQPNNLASLLGIALVGLWWLYETRRMGLGGAAALGTFLGIGLALTQSRAAWGFLALLALWWLIGRHRAQLRTTFFGVAAAGSIFIALSALLPRVLSALDGQEVSAIADRFQSMGTRRVHWPALWDAAWQHPFLGWGWMQVGAAQQAVALDHPPSHEWVTYSHNLILDFMVWIGALPGLAIALAIAWWIIHRARACRDATTWAALGMVGVLSVHSLLEFPYAYAYFLLPLAVIVGVIESRATGATGAVFVVPRAALAAAGAGLVAMLTWICVEYLEVEEMSQRTRFREANYVSAPNQVPQAPDVVLLDSQREFIRFRLTKARPGMSAAELENMERINRRFMPPAVMLRYALAMGLNGRADDAHRNLRLICRMWTAKHCEEGRVSWAAAQEKFPELKAISFPKGPAERMDVGASLH